MVTTRLDRYERERGQRGRYFPHYIFPKTRSLKVMNLSIIMPHRMGVQLISQKGLFGKFIWRLGEL
jgi:hypothetical protein